MSDASIRYTFSAPRKQCFSFPPDVISHLLKNPLSANGLSKLYKTCKYFYSKQQILIVTMPAIFDSGDTPPNMLQIYNHPNILWLNDILKLQTSQFFQLPKIFRCTIHELIITNSFISLPDLQILTSENTIKTFKFEHSTCSKICDVGDMIKKEIDNYIMLLSGNLVVPSDNDTVPLDVILQNLPNITNFEFYSLSEDFSFETLQRMNKLKFSNKMDHFRLSLFRLSPTFNPSLFCEYMKINGKDGTVFEFILLKNVDSFEAVLRATMRFWNGPKITIKINDESESLSS